MNCTYSLRYSFKGAEVVIISHDSSVAEGETGLLACVGEGFPAVDITWMHRGQIVTQSSLISITEEDAIEGERRFKQSFLQICSIGMADAGGYTCVVSNSEASANSSTQLTVTGKRIIMNLQVCYVN